MTRSFPAPPALGRRAALLGRGAVALSPWLPRARAAPAEPKAITLNAAPGRAAVECAFVTDSPGDWMLHCHVTDHQMAGLMTVLRVA